ncbi:MAG: triose-phosphate isomerase family protein [Thermodesulfobacteriota bacterium]
MIRYVLANWKSNLDTTQARSWLATFRRCHRPDPRVQVLVAPSFVGLSPLWQALQEEPIPHLSLAVQDLSPFPLGAYTGAVAAALVRGLATHAMVGHSERRRHFHETPQEIANKVSEATAAGLVPILCLDLPYARAQIGAVADADADRLLIGYGPEEAIGIQVAQAPELAAAAVREIGVLLPGRPLLYGGSVDAGSAAVYLGLPGVSGVMVGSASLDPEGFAAICAAAGR